MLLNIKAISNDIYQNSSKYTGSIMIEPMTVAANTWTTLIINYSAWEIFCVLEFSVEIVSLNSSVYAS